MSDDKNDNVTPIRPGIGQIDEGLRCPRGLFHEPHPLHQQWLAQEPNKLLPTAVRIHLCTKCHLLYWIELDVVAGVPPKGVA